MSGNERNKAVRLANYIQANNVSGADDVFSETGTTDEKGLLLAVIHTAKGNAVLSPEMDQWASVIINKN
jgi:hypothetical protein